jgi:hypothetical protein
LAGRQVATWGAGSKARRVVPRACDHKRVI